jgi:hypothetical protein
VIVVLGAVGAGAVAAEEAAEAYGAESGDEVVELEGAEEMVVCSGEAGELDAGVVITEYEMGISLEDTIVLLAGQSVTSSAQEVIVTADVE